MPPCTCPSALLGAADRSDRWRAAGRACRTPRPLDRQPGQPSGARLARAAGRELSSAHPVRTSGRGGMTRAPCRPARCRAFPHHWRSPCHAVTVSSVIAMTLITTWRAVKPDSLRCAWADGTSLIRRRSAPVPRTLRARGACIITSSPHPSIAASMALCRRYQVHSCGGRGTSNTRHGGTAARRKEWER